MRQLEQYMRQLEQHYSFLMADHQHHFLQRHMLLSKLSSMVNPSFCQTKEMTEQVELEVEPVKKTVIDEIADEIEDEDIFIPEQFDF
jgi:hypothetical protein